MARSKAAILLALLALCASPLLAQQTTGTLVGTVNDDSGAVLPGATVSLTGAKIAGAQTAVSSEKGFFRFPALPPGSYDLTVTMSGFGSQKREGIKISLGATAEENVVLKVSQIQEEITVTGEASVIDTQGNQVATNYDKDWVRNAPVPRFTFFDLINAAPGVNAATSEAGGGITGSRSTSLGGSSSDNSYQVDGTDLTSPSDGNAWPFPNTDAIEEIQVLSLGAPAEYGNVQGAVFNVVTRQGTNAYHGDLNFYWMNQGLTGRNTTDAQDGGNPFHRDVFRDLSVQISGPVAKDKLWFFASYQYQRNGYSVAGTPADSPTRSEADRMFAKINWQITDKNKLQVAYHDDFYRLPYATSAVEDPASVAVEHGHNPTPNVTFTSVLSDKTYIEARYSGFYGKDHGDPIQGGPRVKPRVIDLDTGLISGGIYTWYDGDIHRTGATAKVSHFADNFLSASHDLKFGVQYNQGGTDYIRGYNDLIYTYGYGTGYPFGYTQVPFHDGAQERSVGVFLDDTVRVGSRLSLNLGLRYDNNKASFQPHPVLDADGNETGQTVPGVDNVFTWNSVSPRIGFNLKLTKDGKTVLRGHYGRFYRGIVTGEFDAAAPAVPPRYIFSIDENGNRFDQTLVSDNTNLRVDPNFKDPYTDQYIVGIERELGRNVGLSVNYVYKRGQDYGGWKDIRGVYAPAIYSDTQGAEASGRDITVFALQSDPANSLYFLTNPPEMFSRFHGLTVQLTKRMSDNWQAVASAVWSKSTGRLGSSLNGPADEPSGVASGPSGQPDFGQNPNDYINTDGRLIGDRPFTGKLQFVYMLPKGFMAAINFTHQQGRPWARQVQLPADLVGLPTAILAEPISGDRRVATQNVLDMRLQWELGLGKGAGFALFADLLNLTNDDAYEKVGSRIGTSESFGLPTQFILPRRVMLGAKLKF
jgi:hypothetical protein